MADETTEALLADREKDYGNALDTHTRIAQVWSGILGHEVQPVHVALMMAGLKLVRAEKGPTKKDSYDDALAYVTIARDDIMRAEDPKPEWHPVFPPQYDSGPMQ